MRIVEAERANVPLKRMAYLSFSKAAREVIKQRMKANEADLVWFRTIHGACTKHLGLGQAVLSPYDYRVFSEQTGMKVTPEDTLDFSWQEEQSLDYNLTLRAINLAKTTCRPIQSVLREFPLHRNLMLDTVEHFQKHWEGFKRDLGRFDFMDMLTKYMSDGAPLDIDVGLLDETQDMSLLQWKVVTKMFSRAQRMYMAGDDDQAIYTFIGADEYGFLDHACDEERVLRQSWRVPRDIGRTADEIIRRVGHRKQKDVIWKDAPGQVRVLNLDALTLPWAKYLDEYEDIMVLARHRAATSRFSDDLKMIGVPHVLNGEAMTSWSEAKMLVAYFTLKQGGHVTPHVAQELCQELSVDATALRDLGRKKRVTREMVHIDFESPWINVFASKSRSKKKRYETLRRLVNQSGVEALLKPPRIAISTMHGSKGREADLVVICTDCNNTVRQHALMPAELRLSYVALTRAKKEAAILMPRSDTYITHFLGG
jgi:superfamily I DNA/RNA helicase